MSIRDILRTPTERLLFFKPIGADFGVLLKLIFLSITSPALNINSR